MKIKVSELKLLVSKILVESVEEPWYQLDDIKKRIEVIYHGLKQQGFNNTTKEVRSAIDALHLLTQLQKSLQNEPKLQPSVKYRVR
jgi:hypothetical protein